MLAAHNNNYGRDIWTLTTRQIRNILIVKPLSIAVDSLASDQQQLTYR